MVCKLSSERGHMNRRDLTPQERWELWLGRSVRRVLLLAAALFVIAAIFAVIANR
jgi:hypothetical protein